MAVRGRLVLAVLVAMSCMATVHAACLPAATSDASVTPSNPGITAWPSISGNPISAGCSEVVNVYTQGAYSASAVPWPRTSCPHLASGLTPLETLYPSLTHGASVIINSGSYLLRQCSLPPDTSAILNRITINSGATLVFDDSAISLNVREIWVAAGGSLLIGSESCRLISKITITFYGSLADSSLVDTPTGTTSKGLVAAGVVDVHGKQYHPTWTRLARTVQAGTSVLYLQDAVNWEVGQEVLVTTSVLLDCPDSLAATWCRPCYSWESCTPQKHQNEVRTITGLVMNSTSAMYAVSLSAPLSFRHYAGTEYQSEVALLSRRINFVGSQSGDNFGGHTKVHGSSGRGRFSGVRGENMGQKNKVGRYPFHLHLMYDSDGAHASYFQDCVITNSNFRSIVVHGTNGTRMSRNVAFNITGMSYYLEDGVEENNLLEYNLAAHVHPIKQPADGGGGQGGETFLSSSDLFLPADTSAAGFYIPNAYNTFIGNAASGGWSGFAFPNTPAPLGDFKGQSYAPMARPLKKFLGNTAHSSGFYWGALNGGHGSCVYVGAWLDYTAGGVMQYNSGRNDRDTKWPNGTSSTMLFEDTKVWLCNKGISHWGNTVEIRNVEYHDIKVSSMLFGSAAIYNALVNSATPNLQSKWIINQDKMGFQFYDTWVASILVNITFRNFSASTGYAIRYMDHSDHYTPQGINAVANIRFEQTDHAAILGIDNCGTACGTAHTTMSSKIYSVWDQDGSFSRTGKPTLLGSNQKWWKFDDSCTYSDAWKVYMCDWAPRKTIGYVQLYIPGLMDGCDYSKFSSCTDQYAPNTVGRVSHWGKPLASNFSLDLSPWAGVAGITNTGWYWRPKAQEYGINGAPSTFQVGDGFQLARGSFIVLAVAYPANTNFRVYLRNSWWPVTYPDIAMAASKSIVLTPREDLLAPSAMTCTGTWSNMCQTTGGVGPAWYFDGTHLYLRLVAPGCYNQNQRTQCASAYFESHGSKVWSIMGGFTYNVVATCAGCTVQSTLGSVTYWETPDAPPSAAFTTDYGTVTSVGLPVNKALGAFQCASASTTEGGGGGGASGSASGAAQDITGSTNAAPRATAACTVVATVLLSLAALVAHLV